MRELENIPQDSYNKKKILVEEDIKNPEIINSEVINPQDINLNIEIRENKNVSNNYFWQMLHKNIPVNITILFSLIVLIILEFIFRPLLFTYSCKYIKSLQDSFPNYTYKFCHFMSFLGRGGLSGLCLLFVFCYFPLNKAIILLICFILVFCLHNLLKLIYRDPRPFWINTNLYKGSCETSYGNPSGHCINSIFFFLSFSYYICMLDKIKNKLIYKVIIYFISIFISVLIAFSRLVLGVHTLDQVFYGITIGIWLFLISTYVFKVYDISLSYYLKFYKDKKYILFFLLILIVIFIVPIILCYTIDVDDDLKRFAELKKFKYDKYDEENIKKRNSEEFKFYSHYCMEQKSEFKFYSHNGMIESFIIFLILGVFLGQYLFWHRVYRNYNQNTQGINFELSIDEKINHWNNYYKEIFSSFTNIIILLCLLIICILLPGLFLFIPRENNSLRNILIFRYALPLFLFGFLFHGPFLYGLLYIIKKV